MYNKTQRNSTICSGKPECGACTSQNQNSNIAVLYGERYTKKGFPKATMNAWKNIHRALQTVAYSAPQIRPKM